MIIDMEKIIEKYLNNCYDEDINNIIITIIDTILINNSHFIKVKRSHYKLLSKKDEFSKNTQNMFLDMYNNYSTKTSVITRIPSKVIITDNEFKKENDIFKIPISKLNNYDFSENNILAENIIDCKIYCKLTNRYIKSKNLNGAKIKLKKENGGGATIGKTYENLCIEKRITISIIDSDKKYPNDINGGTAEGLKTTEKKLNQHNNEIFLSDYFFLKVRELENLIPLKIFEILFEHKKGTIFDILRNIDGFEKFYKFIDLKSGLKVKDLKNKNFVEAWRPILEKIDFKNITFKKINSDKSKIENFIDFLIAKCKQKKEDLKIDEKFKEEYCNSLEKSKYKNVKFNSLNKIIECLDNLDKNSSICSGYDGKILDDFFGYLEKKQILKKIAEIKEKEQLNSQGVEKRIKDLRNQIDKLENSYSDLLEDKEIQEISHKIFIWGCCYNNGTNACKITNRLN